MVFFGAAQTKNSSYCSRKKFVNSFVNYLNEIKREKYSPCWLKILVSLSTVNLAWFFPLITTFLLATCLLLLHVMTINCALVRKQPPIPQSGWVIFKLCSTKWFQSASKSLWVNSLKRSNKRALFALKSFMVTSVVQWKFSSHHFKKPRPWVPGVPIVPKPPWLKRWPMLVMKRASEPSAIFLSGIYCNQHREKTDSPRIRPRPGGLISWQNHFGLDYFRKSRAVKTARFDNKQPFLGGDGLGGPGPLASGFDGPGLAGGGSGGYRALVAGDGSGGAGSLVAGGGSGGSDAPVVGDGSEGAGSRVASDGLGGSIALTSDNGS